MLLETAHEQFIAQNLEEYGGGAIALAWVTPEAARRAEEERRGLLTALAGKVRTAANGSKLYTNALSPGCRTCCAGTWSCLFINGICNARCFYCPTSQLSKSEPTTNNLRFPKPRDYISYLEKFGMRGASISGGEPLMTLDRTLNFLARIKEHFGAAIHLWMYTNGILLTSDILKRLQDTGLDEIRFDISANRYRLDKVEMAVGKIPQVTVEIPTVPEDADQLLAAMRELDRLGVNFLNLHQFRLTPHNRPHLAGRNYTYLHGPRVTVLESELAALRLLETAVHERLRLAVNYCSYIYKFRYQTMAARRRSAAFIGKPHETITATGLLRTLTVRADAAELQTLAADLASQGLPADLWQLASNSATLHLAPQLLHFLDPRRHSLSVRYHATALKPAITYHNPYREIELSSRRRLIVERTPLDTELAVSADKLKWFTEKILTADVTAWPEFEPGGNPPTDWEKITASECFRTGLYEYY